MPVLPPVRCLLVYMVMVVLAWSLSPFERPVDDLEAGGRLVRMVEWSRLAIGPVRDLLWHALAYGLVGFGFFIALRRGGIGRRCAIVLGVTLPCMVTVELLQTLLPRRHAHVVDLLANVVGTGLGVIAGVWALRFRDQAMHWYIHHERPVAWGVMSVFAALIGVIQIVPGVWYVSLDDWDESYPLLVGDELGGGRAWLGTIGQIALYDRALTLENVRERYVIGRGGVDHHSAEQDIPPSPGMLGGYDFRNGAGDRILPYGPISLPALVMDDASACTWVAGQGLRLDRATALQSDGAAADLTRAMKATDAMSVEVWCRPANLHQKGPARIVTQSISQVARNFTLGQEGSQLHLRVRNAMSGENGSKPAMHGIRPPLTPAWQHIVGTYNRGTFRLYLDARPQSPSLDVRSSATVLGLGNTWIGHVTAWTLLLLPLVAACRVLATPALRLT